MKALILCAGLGKELTPITSTIPKPMIVLQGKPILQRMIEKLRDCGIKDIVIVVGYRKEQIINYFRNGFDFGVNINYVIQEPPKGVEDAILKAKNLLEQEEFFILIHGDIVAEKDIISRTLNTHNYFNCCMIIALTLAKKPEHYGSVLIDEEGRVKKIVEKPLTGKELGNYVAAGIYILSSEIFKMLEQNPILDQVIQNLIDQEIEIYGAIWEKNWVDVGRPWHILKANEIIMEKKEEARISKRAKIESGVKIEGPALISAGAHIRSGACIIGPCYIGPNAYIGNNSLIREYTDIGRNVIVGFGVELKNCIVMNSSKIGRLCFIGDSIVGMNADIGAAVTTVNVPFNKDETIKMNINDEEVDTGLKKLGAVIGEGAVIGSNVSIYSGKKIGAYSKIMPGTIIDQDIGDRMIVKNIVKMGVFKEDENQQTLI
ncbi:MAG: bifunctional sugar-1-phosphate nucleotidylyltransferase/acetyltransferase [Candidatus Hodarchaeota archaeon]